MGDFRLSGTSPCIDAGDPALPPDPDATIADQGALYYIAPTVQMALQPVSPPIFIPSTGGSFDFNIELENICDSSVVVDAWTDVTLPNGSIFGPIILRTGMTMTVGQIISRDITQVVPGSAPPGYYTYSAYAGTYPDEIISEDSFNFGKIADDGIPGQYFEWNAYGWDLESTVSSAPMDYALLPAFPNPFNPETHLSFTLPEDAQVSLAIYDLSGRIVATLYDGWYPAGSYDAIFGASNLPSGVYFARLEAGNHQQTQKLFLMK